MDTARTRGAPATGVPIMDLGLWAFAAQRHLLRRLLAFNLLGSGVFLRPRLSPLWLLDWLWISAPWPALALAVLGADGSLRLDAWLLGGHWELDAQRRLLLVFTALLWGLAGGYARGYLAAEQVWAAAGDRDARGRLLRFALFWPLTL